jgi:hypothetical protein
VFRAFKVTYVSAIKERNMEYDMEIVRFLYLEYTIRR